MVGNLDWQLTVVHSNFKLRTGCSKADDQRARQPESSLSNQAPAQSVQVYRARRHDISTNLAAMVASSLRVLCHFERVINVDTQVPDCAFNFCVAKQ